MGKKERLAANMREDVPRWWQAKKELTGIDYLKEGMVCPRCLSQKWSWETLCEECLTERSRFRAEASEP